MSKEDKIKYHWKMCTEAMVEPEPELLKGDKGKWWSSSDYSKDNTTSNLINPLFHERTHKEAIQLLPGNGLECSSDKASRSDQFGVRRYPPPNCPK